MNATLHPRHLALSRGFSLVELMVALTISLLLLAGALSILYSSRLAYNENDRLARLQESGRLAMELILRDVRASGFLGCSRPQGALSFVNGINGGATLLYNFQQPLFGFNAAGAGWAPVLDALVIPAAVPGSDALAVRTARQGQPELRLNAPVTVPTADISVDRPAGVVVPAPTTMIISDCRGASAFTVTNFVPDGATTGTLAHAAGGPGANTNDSITRAFDIGASVVPVSTVIYYVRESPTGNGPSLWQRVGAADPQSLVEGVENLQLVYGIDTDGDLLANQYVTADVVPNWNDVISLSIAMLVRSEIETNPEVDTRTYDLLGTIVGPFNDRRQRTVFTTTITLRNRTN